MPDVVLTTGVDTSGIATGMAAIRNETQRVGTAIQNTLGSLFSPAAIITGALTAGIGKILDLSNQIHHEATRFAVDAAQLQLIGNAAKEDGLSLETTARAMNMLTLNAQKGLDPMSAQAKALNDLGIDAEKFAHLNADEQFLQLADAYSKSAKDGAAYADVATLIGRRNTELIPILAKGSASIREQGEAMGIISTKNIERINAMHDSLKQAGGQLQVLGATGIASLKSIDDAIKPVMDTLRGLTDQLRNAVGLSPLFGGASEAGPAAATNVALQEQINLTEQLNTLDEKRWETETLVEQTLDKENTAWMASLTNAEKLAELQQERSALQAQLTEEVANEGDQTERALELRGNIADLTTEIIPLEARVADEISRAADEAAREADEQAKAAFEAQRAADEAERNAIAEAKAADEAQRKAKADQEAANANQIREAAGALAYYNLRIGDFAPYLTGPGGKQTPLTGDALNIFNQIQKLGAQLSTPGLSASIIQGIVNRLNALQQAFMDAVSKLTGQTPSTGLAPTTAASYGPSQYTIAGQMPVVQVGPTPSLTSTPTYSGASSSLQTTNSLLQKILGKLTPQPGAI